MDEEEFRMRKDLRPPLGPPVPLWVHPIAGSKRPDLIWGPYAPLKDQVNRNAGRNWLVTEVKLSMKTVLDSAKNNPGQLDAMVNYTHRYAMFPIASWIVLFKGAGDKAAMLKQFEGKLISKGIAGLVMFITEKVGPNG